MRLWVICKNPQAHAKVRNKERYGDCAQFRHIRPQDIAADQRMQYSGYYPDSYIITENACHVDDSKTVGDCSPTQICQSITENACHVDDSKTYYFSASRRTFLFKSPIFVQAEAIQSTKRIGQRIIEEQEICVMGW